MDIFRTTPEEMKAMMAVGVEQLEQCWVRKEDSLSQLPGPAAECAIRVGRALLEASKATSGFMGLVPLHTLMSGVLRVYMDKPFEMNDRYMGAVMGLMPEVDRLYKTFMAKLQDEPEVANGRGAEIVEEFMQGIYDQKKRR